MSPREGHLIALKKMWGYLKGHMKGRILFDTRPMDVVEVEYFEGSNWHQIYGDDLQEDLPPDMPKVKMKPVQITIYFAASHGNYTVTRKSVTGILVFVNRSLVWSYCKKQNTIEASTYRAELMAC